jgi:hypothetical protein
MTNCCPPTASCIPCPIVLSCDIDFALSPGQLQFCPDSCKFYYDCAGQKSCLNPTYGLGLRMSENCILQVGLAEGRPLVFDDSGNIDIDCEKLITCCQLVTQAQFAIAIDNLYQYIITTINNLSLAKKCDGTPLAQTDRVFEVGSIKKLGATTAENLGCGDVVLTYGDLRKCVDGVSVPLEKGDIVQVITCTPSPPVGSPPVGSPPVGSPPVGSPPVGSGGCCDLFNAGAKNYNDNYTNGVYTSGSGTIWNVDYQCGLNAYIPWDVQVSAGSMPPGLVQNGINPNSNGSGQYSFNGFSGTLTPPAVTTTYTFTLAIRPFSASNSCVSYAEITYTVSINNNAPAPVGSAPIDGVGG